MFVTSKYVEMWSEAAEISAWVYPNLFVMTFEKLIA
jgi:hypothetical protein